MFARILLQLYELSTQNDVRVHYQIDKANGQGHNPPTFLKGFIVVVFFILRQMLKHYQTDAYIYMVITNKVTRLFIFTPEGHKPIWQFTY